MTTKVHFWVDATGNPLKLILSPDNEVDITYTKPLMLCFFESDLAQIQAVIADKGYDINEFVVYITHALEAMAVIPSRCNRKQSREHDKERYKDRRKV
ncbi:MAG TPA: hypothetical protein PLO56_01425 [Rhodothermales bacterium]|nr:hypothetical protein [Rhodothermales bacterium]